MQEYVVQTEQLTKQYGDFTAVNHLDMEVEQGEIFGFLGPNGAGKTTTVLMLMGLSVPSSGTAKVGGHDIIEESREVRSVASILPEYSSLYGDLTTFENLDYLGQLNDMPREERENRIHDVLEIVGMSEWLDAKYESFSRGMKQRVGIASTMMKNPKVVFLDEPTLGLDPVGTREIRELILDLKNRQGLTVVMTSHILSEVQLTCDRIGIINRGRLVLKETMANLNHVMTGAEDRRVDFKLTKVTPELVKDIEAINGVKEVKQENGRLYVYGTDDTDIHVSQTIVEHGSTILLMKPREYTLEEIFMKYYQQEAD
ncbi:MAG: ABC transporter ATP-binding protein [Candidatus Bathyarchaeota archaeon]|nr:ABC transporter ATP-binding protein [Candidatus Bathyarchaeota archaeon]